jgi:acyl carrier protein
MSDAEIRALVLDVLGGIAPEADPATLADEDDLRETLDLDSMDFLNLVTALHERTGIDIPERDYPELFTLKGAVAFLAARSPAA